MSTSNVGKFQESEVCSFCISLFLFHYKCFPAVWVGSKVLAMKLLPCEVQYKRESKGKRPFCRL